MLEALIEAHGNKRADEKRIGERPVLAKKIKGKALSIRNLVERSLPFRNSIVERPRDKEKNPFCTYLCRKSWAVLPR